MAKDLTPQQMKKIIIKRLGFRSYISLTVDCHRDSTAYEIYLSELEKGMYDAHFFKSEKSFADAMKKFDAYMKGKDHA